MSFRSAPRPALLLALVPLVGCDGTTPPSSAPARPASRLERALAEREPRTPPVELVHPAGTTPEVAATAAPVEPAPEPAAPVPAAAAPAPVAAAPAVAPATQPQRARGGEGTPRRDQTGGLNRVPLGVTRGERLDGTQPKRNEQPVLPDSEQRPDSGRRGRRPPNGRSQ